MADREIIYLDRDNTIDLLLKASGSAQDLSGVTHVEAVFSGVTVSSSTSPALFSGTTSATGQVVFKFGSANISAGSYQVKVIVYDLSNTNGILWDTVPVVVK